ncbi:MAG: twin-arginine translocase TatA/TatE family subunit [Berryella intestinalis]|uniref:Sec-independent protein translocase subunit TatA/TatB n=1 Tax=Berryella intestinalis TaxID=1531429 RepID=UPI002A4E2FC9|nr:twin-arginine translocase TatA/TatE family subunit [Berryella intestinalis]MDD7369705.1 twin-arginine translocase TatA/TatE family subunit [Berryella intestinalis]MDY3128586.1 twin-arginine translocase TatA/TatE family subunit [Berryella intestinalis]
MFGIGGFELFLILLFGFLIFGPDKLPAMAKTLGRWIAKFRSAQQEMSEVIKNDVFDPNSDEPFKDPTEAVNKVVSKVSGVTKAAVDSKKAASEPAPASGASASSGASSAAPEDKKPAVAPRQESFTERKARYERERAAKKAAEEAAAKEAAAQPASDAAATPADNKTEGGE